MKPTEEHVWRFLVHRGYSNIRYEPDGPSTTPDFAIEDQVAVEVRSLNQHHVDEHGVHVGLATTSRSLADGVARLIQTLGSPPDGETWFVFPKFRRPVPAWSELKKDVKTALLEFRSRTVRTKSRISVQDNFALDLWPASRPLEQFYVLGGYSDRDSGGWVFEELHRNLKICISEKSRKTARARATGRYGDWWLALVDQIGYGRDASYRAELHQQGLPCDGWAKIILIDPLDHTRAWELWPLTDTPPA